jgi:hypothetical protein
MRNLLSPSNKPCPNLWQPLSASSSNIVSLSCQRRKIQGTGQQPGSERSQCNTSSLFNHALAVRHHRSQRLSATGSFPWTPSANGPPSFDIGLAIALAGCAFEAYNEPEGADGFKEVALNGTTTTYVNRYGELGTQDHIGFSCDGYMNARVWCTCLAGS